MPYGAGQIKNDEKTLDGLIDQEAGIFNSIASKQQADAMQDYAEDMAKCLETARRISRGTECLHRMRRS